MDVHQYFIRYPNRDYPEINQNISYKSNIQSTKIYERYVLNTVYVDEQIGILYDFLKDEGLLDNTILVITSDHGEQFNEHDFIGHGYNVYNEEIKVPLIIRYPAKVPVNERFEGLTGNVDIFPTLMDLCNLNSENMEFEGIDIFNDKTDNRFLYTGFTAHTGDKKAVIHDNWKLIYNSNDMNYYLYNLLNDPEEQNPLSLNNHNIAVVMLDSLQAWMEAMDSYQMDLSRTFRISDIEVKPDIQQLRAIGYIK